MSTDNPLGSASQWAWGFESARDVPNLSSLYGLTVATEAFAPKIGSEATKNVSPYNHALQMQRVKLDVAGNLDKQPDVDSLVRMRAHYQGWCSITEPVTDVFQWLCRPWATGDPALASYIETLYARRFMDDAYEERISGGKIGKSTLKVEKNKIIDFSQQMIFGDTTHFDEPVEVAVNAAYTGQLVFRGWGDETDTRKLRLKATVPGALDGTAKVEATFAASGTVATSTSINVVGTGTKFLTEYTVGGTIFIEGETIRTIATIASDTAMTLTAATAATATGLDHFHAAYGGAARRMSVYANVWSDVILPDGERMGANYPHARVQWMLTSGGVLTLDDEWAVAQQRGQTVVTYVQKKPLTAVGCRLYVAGAEIEIEGVTIELDRPRLAYFTTGSAAARRVIDNGERNATATIKRMYLDRTFLRLARSGAKVALLVEMRGGRLGTTAHYEGWDIASPNLQFDEAGPNGISGPTSFSEDIKATMYFDPDTGAAPVTETITTSVETLV